MENYDKRFECPERIWIYDVNIRHDISIMWHKPSGEKRQGVETIEYVRADLVEKMKGKES